MQKLFEHPVLARGFRPFFLIGAVYAVLIVPLWVMQMRGGMMVQMPFDDPVIWHGHEMIYGFTMAVVTGFLLTAVANWTGGSPARQVHLAALCVLWLAGRMAMNFGMPYAVSAAIDLAFIPALAVSLAIPLVHSRNVRNFVFLGLLGSLFLCDLWLFLSQDRKALYLAAFVIAAMISLIGGRIIPAFTVAALRRQGIAAFVTDQPRADKMAFLSLAVLGLMWIAPGPDHWAAALAAGAAALIHLWRIRVWHTRKILLDPLLLILHGGYLWLTLSLALLALSFYVSALPRTIALHALTAGAIGSMTVGMMVRVALGHTGRELKTGVGGCLSFLLLQAAIVTRVIFPLADSGHPMIWLEISAGLWASSFLTYLVFYAPILWRPRADGLPP